MALSSHSMSSERASASEPQGYLANEGSNLSTLLMAASVFGSFRNARDARLRMRPRVGTI